MTTRVLDAILAGGWYIQESALRQILDIANRQNDVTPQALEAYSAQAAEKTAKAKVRNGVAVLDVTGPLFKRANLMTAMSGATAYSELMTDFRAMMDDPTVKGIMLNVDSPGGHANGCGELARAIFAARGPKPITAYVGGSASSAAYWIASAADKIVCDQASILGSIGAMMALQDSSAADEKRGLKTYTFVSSQSPMKNKDPATQEGADHIQATVDALAQVFIEGVAANRGVDTETVLSDFGKGALFVGQQAVDAGLANAIGSYETVMAELAASPFSGSARPTAKDQPTIMSDEASAAADHEAALTSARTTAATSAATAERSRAKGILALASAHGVDGEAALDAGTSVEAFALEIAASAKATRAANVLALRKDETDSAKPGASTEAPVKEEPTAESMAAEIMTSAAAFVPK